MRSTRIILILSLLLLVTGSGLNYFYGYSKDLYLQPGEIQPIISDHADTVFLLGLDTIALAPHTPEFEIQLWEQDTTVQGHQNVDITVTGSCIKKYSLEPMVIRGIPDSDFGFRVADFYPNFTFAYTYPDQIDTIPPRAPGVTLELDTEEGNPVLTLRADQPGKNTLDDIMGLGARLLYYWNVSDSVLDSIIGTSGDIEDIILLTGEQQNIILIRNQIAIEKITRKGDDYKIPGKDRTGFRVLHWFPDIAHLKAIPVSEGEELSNPVAGIHVWRQGQGYQEVFLYPQAGARRGGFFQVPGTQLSLVLGPSLKKTMRHCHAVFSVYKPERTLLARKTWRGGGSAGFGNYRYSVTHCNPGGVYGAILDLGYRPGRIPILVGILLAVLAFLVLLRGSAVRKVIS